MRRALVLATAAVVGAVLGAAATVAAQGGDDRPIAETAAPAPPVPVAEPSPASTEQLLLAWTPGALPADLADAAAVVPGVRTVAMIRGGPVTLLGSSDDEGKPVDDGAGPEAWPVALDTIAVEPATYAEVIGAADRPAVESLAAGEAILGATSARLRGAAPGATLRLAGGHQVTIVAVVPDETVGGAELAVDVATGAALGVEVARALVILHEGDRAAVEAALAGALPPGTPVRFRAPGETPFLRAGDAVLPPAAIKEAFGEFGYRVPDPASRDVDVDPSWVEANVATAEVPALGPIRCHRAVLPALVGAMTELTQKNLAAAVVTYDGCWVPRLVEPGGPLSRHAWGVAIDLNFASNSTGTGSTQDPRLVEIMERWGFTWGGRWLEPDPAHFEYVAPLSAA